MFRYNLKSFLFIHCESNRGHSINIIRFGNFIYRFFKSSSICSKGTQLLCIVRFEICVTILIKVVARVRNSEIINYSRLFIRFDRQIFFLLHPFCSNSVDIFLWVVLLHELQLLQFILMFDQSIFIFFMYFFCLFAEHYSFTSLFHLIILGIIVPWAYILFDSFLYLLYVIKNCLCQFFFFILLF